MNTQHRHKKYHGTFFIFPSLIPLIEILPWLLTMVGSLAGGMVVMKSFLKKHYRQVLLYGMLTICILGTGGMYIAVNAQRNFENLGSQLVPERDYAVLETLKEVEPYTTFPTPPYQWEEDGLHNIWTVRSEDVVLSTPVLSDDLMLIGTFNNTLQARSLHDGSLLWTLKKNHPIYSPPVITKDRIYVGEGLHFADYSHLSALSYPDGKTIWQRRFPSHLESYPVLDEDHERLWIAGGATGLWSLSTKDGSKKWWAQIGHVDSAPLYKDGRLFTAAKLREYEDGSAFFELSPDSGKIKWSVPMEGNPMSDVQDLGNDRFLISTALGQVGITRSTDNGWVYSIDLNLPQKIRWKTKLSTMPLPDGHLSKDKKTVYYALKNGQIWALDTENGDVLWIKKLGEEFKSNLELFEEGDQSYLIAYEAKKGTVYVLDAATGEPLQAMTFKVGSYAAPIYDRGVLYIAAPHYIHAYKIRKE